MTETDSSRPTRPSRRGVWLALPWFLALLALLALHVWFPRIDVEPLNDTYSAAIGGRNAFYQFAERRWPGVTRNLDPLYRRLERLDPDTTLCILGPARSPTPREWKALLEWVARGGTLLFAAPWSDPEVEIPDRVARVRNLEEKKSAKKDRKGKKEGPGTGDQGPEKKAAAKTEAGGSESKESAPTKDSPEKDPEKKGTEKKEAAESEPAEDAGAGKSDEKTRKKGASGAKPFEKGPKDPGLAVETNLIPPGDARWHSSGVVEAAGGESLVKTAKGEQVMRLSHGAGTIVLCASDQIFSNAALVERERPNALLAVRLLEAAGTDRPIVFDESLNATGTPRVVGLLLDPHLRPVTLQILIVLLVFGWRGGRRFGALLPSDAAPRHNLADHTDSLGNLYWKARNGQGALRAYLDQLRRQLRLHTAVGRDPRGLAPLAARCGMPVEEVQKLLAQADSAAAKEKLSRREAAHLIRRLARLRVTAPVTAEKRRDAPEVVPTNPPAAPG